MVFVKIRSYYNPKISAYIHFVCPLNNLYESIKNGRIPDFSGIRLNLELVDGLEPPTC